MGRHQLMHGKKAFIGLVTWFLSPFSAAQVDGNQDGAWYMYFWGTVFEDSQFGIQGDIQHRNWDIGGDLEQLLIRAGGSWSPENSRWRYTLGYAHIVSGEFGPSGAKSRENRLYQEALIPQQLGRKMGVSVQGGTGAGRCTKAASAMWVSRTSGGRAARISELDCVIFWVSTIL